MSQKRSLYKYRLSISEEHLLQLTEQRKKWVIDLSFNQHKTYTEIAQIEWISACDIHTTIKQEQSRRQNYKHKKQQEEISSKAYKLFSEGKDICTSRHHSKPKVDRSNQIVYRILEAVGD